MALLNFGRNINGIIFCKKLPSAGGSAPDPDFYSKLQLQTYSARTSSIKHSIFIVVYKVTRAYELNWAAFAAIFYFRSRL